MPGYDDVGRELDDLDRVWGRGPIDEDEDSYAYDGYDAKESRIEELEEILAIAEAFALPEAWENDNDCYA